MSQETVVSNVKALLDEYTTMDYVFPAILIFGTCTMFFFILLVIFGNDKIEKMKKAKAT
ncbi:unnamed protein product [Rodentolepis nana]|uniref:Dolichyl-diphosphooligosaccharide--protein glycosyltransferase subunit 4 n=1 Tax=Rodentolepis nana TaxID=102285 RepID=A0A0R3TMC8_RODNA|nr:unnamed protein product [Rodentolepis nana]